MSMLVKNIIIAIILLTALHAGSEVEVVTGCDTDSCAVGDSVNLTVKLLWHSSEHTLSGFNLMLPNMPALDIKSIGSERGAVGDSVYYSYKIKIMFLIPGKYILNNLKIQYSDSTGFHYDTVIAFPAITVSGKRYRNPLMFVADNKAFLYVILILLVLISIFIIRYKLIKKDIKAYLNGTENKDRIRYIVALQEILGDKKINYHGSIDKLNAILDDFSNEIEKDGGEILEEKNRIEELRKKLEILKNKNFVPYNDLENIYGDIYKLIIGNSIDNRNGG